MKVRIKTEQMPNGALKTAELLLHGRAMMTVSHNTPGDAETERDASDKVMVGRLFMGLAQFNKEAEETIQECLDNLEREADKS